MESATRPPGEVSIYEPLREGMFRLLKFERYDAEKNELHCTLGGYDLVSVPRYTALSYTWKDLIENEFSEEEVMPTPGFEAVPRVNIDRRLAPGIWVNGHACATGSNLASALRHMQHEYRVLTGDAAQVSDFLGKLNGYRYTPPWTLSPNRYVWADQICINQNCLPGLGD
jgi:hypothetical protein